MTNRLFNAIISYKLKQISSEVTEMSKVIVVKENGVIDIEDFKEKRVEYDFLSNTVGGYIELAQRKFNGKWYDLYINEEGRLIDLPPTLITNYEDFRGNVVICKSKGEYNIPLTDEEAFSIAKKLMPAIATYRGKRIQMIATEEAGF